METAHYTRLTERLTNAANEFLKREHQRTGADRVKSLSELADAVLGDRTYFTRLNDERRGISSKSFDRFQAHFASHGYDPDELARAGAAQSEEAA